MKRINVKNMIKLIILLIAVVIPIHDFVTLIIETFSGNTVGLTYFGIAVNIVCLFTAHIIIDDLSED